MISFENDYLEGAHEKVLEKIVETNYIQEPGYGNDEFSKEAIEKIKQTINQPDSSVYFLGGGTQTNQVVIDAVLKKYEGVIGADTSHINVHEAGAIEFSGHKVITLPSENGKITAAQVKKYINDLYEVSNYTHMVTPGMVYITYPTEYGTLYTKPELVELSNTCKTFNIPLYIDGARLGYGLVSDEADLDIKDIANLADIFYIGGTKIGALCGEAIVFTEGYNPSHFVSIIKQHGALLAKSRLVGVQFSALFSDDLYFNISMHAVEMALKIKKAFVSKGYQLYIDSPTNQHFFLIDNKKIKELSKKVKFTCWEKYDDNHKIVRFATSWATRKKDVDFLIEQI
ncbi:threonine aldolase family protein [Staphylococcus carnosus]|uniref:threonine aldolase family protein n=1 Tax=Staphylococcus carnosus TaxID=1281 RepID=UPI00081AA5B3|nr:aminotransferase class I/II-fold pyridoxal phosphate-dependent enzyme [Staphylococcus carnosus]ANZ32933.1 threonine aldolase [Staphylococcus carnosus]UTB80301.1 threonine aldolase [Staphylococcus carnosus]UTB85066.1 threonine aldolase [Staphylococcus carnosus]